MANSGNVVARRLGTEIKNWREAGPSIDMGGAAKKIRLLKEAGIIDFDTKDLGRKDLSKLTIAKKKPIKNKSRDL